MRITAWASSPTRSLAADRYIALFPSSDQMPYVLFLKGTAYFAQMTDITRDQQDDAERDRHLHAADLRTIPSPTTPRTRADKMAIAIDQLAGKEMSVGRYYEGNGQYAAAINRFRNVVDHYQTSSHIEEALFRLTECESVARSVVGGTDRRRGARPQLPVELLVQGGLRSAAEAGSRAQDQHAEHARGGHQRPAGAGHRTAADSGKPVPPPVI